MAEREQFLNADMAGQKERTQNRVQQEGSQRIERGDNKKPNSLEEQIAERNQEYAEADQNNGDKELGWELRQQQIAGTAAGGELKGMAGSNDGQEGGEGGSTSRSSEAPGGNNRYGTGQ